MSKLIAGPVLLALVACGGGAPPEPKAASAPPAAAPPTAADAREVGPWGAAVPSAEQEEHVRASLVAIADGRGAEVVGKAILIGPGMWKPIAPEPAFAGLGIRVVSRMVIGDEELSMLGHGFRNEEIATVMASPTMRELGRLFAEGEVRAATEEERQVVYAGISWEIAGKPLTVSRAGATTLVIHLDDEGKITVLDYLEPLAEILRGDRSGLEVEP